MRYYSYIVSDDDIEITKLVYSEKEILDEFWLYWSNEMKGNGFAELISYQACIDDWCTMNWAQREDVFKFKTGYDGKDFVINEFNFQDPTFNLATVICLNDASVVIDRYVNLSLEMERADVLE